MFHMPFRPVIAIILLCFGAITIACNGSGGSDAPLTLAGYFQRLQRLDHQAQERNDALAEELDAALERAESEEEQFQAARAGFLQGALSIDEFITDLEDLAMPEEVRDAHDRVIAAGEALLASFQGLAQELDRTDTADVLERLLGDRDLNEIAERYEEACEALEDAADENGIDIDLNCAED